MSEPDRKPIIEQVKDYVPDTNTVKETFTSATTAISNGIDNAKTGVQNTLGEFSQKGVVGASNEFLESNGLFAKFAFIVLVLIIFLFLFKLGINLISYFSQASNSPYIVKGLLEGTSGVTITQDPKDKNSVQILRSVNAMNGAEYTWSVWLYLQYNDKPESTTAAATATKKEKIDTIFVKGPTNSFSDYGLNSVNGPGLYIEKDSDGKGFINVAYLMDDIVSNKVTKLSEITNKIYIKSLPLNKWVHLAFRLQNTVLDAYVNGVITQRLQLQNAPKQNFYDILVAPGGFQGKLSNLQYFNRALNVFEINNIVMFGPNLKDSKHSKSAQNATGNYSYLNTSWYSGWYNGR